MTLTVVERRVLEAVDAEGLLSTLADLIAIRSLSGQETPAQEYVTDFMVQLGMEVDVWELDFDVLRQHPAFSTEFERPSALGVVGAMGEDAGGRILIAPRLVVRMHIDYPSSGAGLNPLKHSGTTVLWIITVG